MPSLDLLLLPLLGGFIFVSQWYPTKYSAFRSAGNRLVFFAAVAGAVFLFVASLLITPTYSTDITQTAASLWHEVVPFEHSGKAALSLLLGAFLWLPLNFLGRWVPLLSDSAAVNRAILRKRDPLELLLRQALGQEQTIAVTLKNGKVYIGKVTTNLNPGFDTESIHLLLRRSGHRDPETQTLLIDVDYDKTHAEVMEAAAKEFRGKIAEVLAEYPKAGDAEIARIARERMSNYSQIQNYEVVLLVSEIVSANYFDLRLYDRHFSKANGKPA